MSSPSARLRADQSTRLRTDQSTRLRVGQSARLRVGQSARLRVGQSARLRVGQSTRLRAGQLVSPFTVSTLSHGSLTVPTSARATHLQFRRFAGCPICNRHLRRFAVGWPRLQQAGVQTLAFFHSAAEEMLTYQRELPFPIVADPTRHWYRQFGVERSAWASLHPRAMASAMRGLLTAPGAPWAGGADPRGLPADVLLAPSGEVLAVKYGTHADDQWQIEELLALVG